MSMNAAPPPSRQLQPSKDAIDFLASILGGDAVRLITLDTRNPLGGRGGSLESDQCAWLVRELAKDPDRGVIVTTRHRSLELRNSRTVPGTAPRILGEELVPILLAHANVLGWIGGHRHRPSAIRHGVRDSGLWEMTPSLLGFGSKAWIAHQRRRAVVFSPQRLPSIPVMVLTRA
jgi:hypothetical protein